VTERKCARCPLPARPERTRCADCAARAVAYSLAWARHNSEKVAATQAAWRAANPDYALSWARRNSEYVNAVSREWRAANPEKAVMAARRWAAANPEKTRLYGRRSSALRRERDPAGETARGRAWRLANPDRQRANARAWAATFREKVRASKRRWQLAHPELLAVYVENRRARLLAAPGKFTLTEWKAKVALLGGCCVYCGRDDVPMTMDHKVPLYRNGTNDITNIVPACGRCNSSKGTRTAREFLGLTA